MLSESWALCELREIAEIGPKFEAKDINIAQLVHFVPMAAVAENFGCVNTSQLRPFGEVRKGYTFFAQGDVLFAKITPCMENGKGGLVPFLPHIYAFGSTEFHVIRPLGAISSQWLAYYLSQPEFRKVAKQNMTGSAGQLRVPTKWLEAARLPVPPQAEQTRIVEKLEELLSDLDAGIAELKAAQKKLAQYRQSLLKAAVEGALTAEWRAQRQQTPSPQPLPREGGGANGAGASFEQIAAASSVAQPTAGRGMALSWCGEGASQHVGNPQNFPLPPRGGGVRGEGVRNTALPQTLNHAKALRRNQTPQEQALWQTLRAKRFDGYKFRRQQPLGPYIVDFVCFARRLIIELDGSQHAETVDYDTQRDNWLREQGFRVLRFWNSEYTSQPEAVLEAIWQALQDSPPLPNPSPSRGEGLQLKTGAQLLERILTERRARWEARQLAKFEEQGKIPPKDWQKKYPEPVRPDTNNLPELPEGWVWASVDQLSPDDLANGRSVPTADRGAKVLRLTAVREGRIDLTESKCGAWADDEARPFGVQEGDLLVVRGNGSLSLVGRAGLVPAVAELVAYPDTLIRLRVLTRIVDPTWVAAMWDSAVVRRHIEKRARTSAGIYKISQSDIVSAAIPVPPLSEQTEALARLTALQAEVSATNSAVDRSLKQSTAQRQNILRAAFSGQLVPQDPNDEPASVLLERIRAERATQGSNKTERGRNVKKS